MRFNCIFWLFILHFVIDRNNSNNYIKLDYYKHSMKELFTINPSFLFEKNNSIILKAYDTPFGPLIRNELFYESSKEIFDSISDNKRRIPLILHSFIFQQVLSPSSLIQDRVNSFSSLHFTSDYVLGIHLRTGLFHNRTEKHSFFNNFPHYQYIARTNTFCESLIAHNYTCKVYISLVKNSYIRFLITDCSDIKDRARLLYPSLLTYNSTIGHSGRSILGGYSPAVSDLITELYLLSKCDMIYGTPYSSLSTRAKILASV